MPSKKPIFRPRDWNDLDPRPFYRALLWFCQTDEASRDKFAVIVKNHVDAHPRDTKWANLLAVLLNSPYELDPDPVSRYSIGETCMQAQHWASWVKENCNADVLEDLRLRMELWHNETGDTGYSRLANVFGWKGQWKLSMKDTARKYRIAQIQAKLNSEVAPPPPTEMGWTKAELQYAPIISHGSMMHQMMLGVIPMPPAPKTPVDDVLPTAGSYKQLREAGLAVSLGECVSPYLNSLGYGDILTSYPYPRYVEVPELQENNVYLNKPGVLFVNSHGKSKFSRLQGRTVYITSIINGDGGSKAINDGKDDPDIRSVRRLVCPGPEGFQQVPPPGKEGHWWYCTKPCCLMVTVGFGRERPLPEMTRWYIFDPKKGLLQVVESVYTNWLTKYLRKTGQTLTLVKS